MYMLSKDRCVHLFRAEYILSRLMKHDDCSLCQQDFLEDLVEERGAIVMMG